MSFLIVTPGVRYDEGVLGVRLRGATMFLEPGKPN